MPVNQRKKIIGANELSVNLIAFARQKIGYFLAKH